LPVLTQATSNSGGFGEFAEFGFHCTENKNEQSGSKNNDQHKTINYSLPLSPIINSLNNWSYGCDIMTNDKL